MTALTAAELLNFNNLSQLHNAGTRLGDKINEIIDQIGAEGTPVNSANATKTLTLTGVVIDGETVTIDNPAVAGSNVYEFLADAAQTKTSPSNIAVNITAHTTKSTGTVTMDTQPTAGDKVVIGGRAYTFVPVGTNTAPGEVSVGANLAGAQAALVAAINGTDGINSHHPSVSAGNFAANACTITALVGGTAGNSIGTAESFTAETNVFAAVALGSGADCSAANAITALVAAITASDTQGVGAEDGAGDTVVLTADTAGAAGNNIVIGETLANATFAGDAVKLSGGVNGTVAKLGKMLLDASYLYVCIADNTIAGKNWRRISVGSAY